MQNSLISRGIIKDIPLLFVFFLVIFLNQFKFQINQNEGDLLANALHYVNPNWLSKDWYLNLFIPYRVPFNFIVGHSISAIGVWTSVFIGRCITYFVFAFFLLKITRLFKLHYILILFFLLYFLPNQSLAAGEWMLRDLETKVFAYLGILMGSYAFYKKQYVFSLGLYGFALSLHLLVGIYGAFCLFACFLFFYPQYKNDNLKLIKALPAYLLFGGWGIFAVYEFVFQGANNKLLTNEGWFHYVTLRVPHHVLPFWEIGQFIMFFAIILLLIVVYKKSKEHYIKYFSIFTLFSALISLVGFLVYALLPIQNMKFYWFRLGDVLLPFFGFLLLFAFIKEKWGNEIESKIENWKIYQFKINQPKYFNLLLLSIVFVICATAKKKTSKTIFKSESYNTSVLANNSFDIEMSEWIKNNSPKDAIIIMPSLSNFYFDCERATVACFKFSPQNDEDIQAWYNRMVDLNNGQNFMQTGFDAEKELQKNYRNIDDKHVNYLSKKYNATYFLTYTDAIILNAKKVFKTKEYVLYAL